MLQISTSPEVIGKLKLEPLDPEVSNKAASMELTSDPESSFESGKSN